MSYSSSIEVALWIRFGGIITKLRPCIFFLKIKLYLDCHPNCSSLIWSTQHPHNVLKGLFQGGGARQVVEKEIIFMEYMLTIFCVFSLAMSLLLIYCFASENGSNIQDL